MCRGSGGKLKEAGQQLLNTLETDPDLEGLVEHTRATFPERDDRGRAAAPNLQPVTDDVG